MYNFILAAVLVLVSFFNIFAAIGPVINTDLLHLPMMYNDWAAGQLNWFFYNLPPSRYIFPDIPVFFFLRGLLGEGVLAMLVNAWLNYLLIAALLLVNARIWFRASWRSALLPVLLALTLLSVPNLFPNGLALGLWWPTMHAGAVIFSLIVFCLLGVYLRAGSTASALALGLSGFFLGLTDPLCFVIAMLPVVVALLFHASPALRHRIVTLALFLIMVLMGSWLGDRLAPAAFLKYLHQHLPEPGFLRTHLLMFIRDLTHPLVVSWVVVLFLGLWALWRHYRHRTVNGPLLTGLLVALLAPIAAMLLNGRYMDIECVRYFSLSLLLALLAGLGWVYSRIRYRRILAACGLTLAFLPVLLWQPALQNWQQMTHPQFLAPLALQQKRLHLKAGLTDYETARLARYFGPSTGPVMNILEPDASTFLKLGNLGWLGLSLTPEPRLEYNFILFKNETLSRDYVLLRFGPPSRIEHFRVNDDIFVIWLYDYDLGIMLERDPYLWTLLNMRLSDSSYFLTPAQRHLWAGRLLSRVQDCERLQDELDRQAKKESK